MKLNENRCNDILEWTRTCPQCNSIIEFSSKSNYSASVKSGCFCKKCSSVNNGLKRRKVEFGVNERYGKFVILNECSLENKPNNDVSHRYFKCRCDCGNVCIVKCSDLKRKHTQSCGCIKGVTGARTIKKWRDNGGINTNRRFVGDVSGAIWCKVCANAKIRNIPVNITKEYIWDLFLKQNRKCALTGLDLVLSPLSKDQVNNNASLDRIDSAQGYIPGNVQWVTKNINLMKLRHSNEDFIKLCKLVAEHNK